MADELAEGVWSLVAFDAEAAGRLWLPHHLGEPCHGDAMPLGGASAGSEGLSLGDAVGWLRDHQDTYRRLNPSCWGRIGAARDSTWGPLVVAPFGVGDRRAPPGTRLVLVDGLHRALGWALRAAPDAPVAPETHDTGLRAFLAGPLSGTGTPTRHGGSR